MVKSKCKIIIAASLLVIILGGLGLYIRSILFTNFNTTKTVYIYIDQSKNYDKLLSQIDTLAHVRNLTNFKILSSYIGYPEIMKTGRYAITPDMNIRELIHILQTGQQTPVNLRFNNIRTKKDLAKHISAQLMMNEQDMLLALKDSVKASQFGFTPETFVSMFIPNTYQIYWDIDLNDFILRMDKEYNKFWTSERLSKASKLGLTQIQVSILASIVEEECYFSDEYPIVAGLYLNRLTRGQLLQADPTVKFAVGDFSLRRILNKHLDVVSPYNTYKHLGLPPGPIRLPSIKSIDSVLNPSTHNYLYMCAKEDFSGRHNFAVTHAEHERNANRYRQALNKRRIF